MKLSQTNGTLLKIYGGSIYDSLAHLKRCGFKYIDVSFFECFIRGSRYWTEGKAIADEYKKAFCELELVPVQCHEPAGNMIGDDGGEYYMKKTPASMAIASAIGVPMMVIHPGCREDLIGNTEKSIEENIKAIKRLMPVAEKYNMKVLLENMPEFTPMNADELIAIVDGVDHELLGVNWDVGHGNIRGLSQYDEITKLGSRLWGVHLHDNCGFFANQENTKENYSCHYDIHLPPFYGNINYNAVMTALLEIGFEGTFNFEADGPQLRSGVIPFVKDGVEIDKLGRQLPPYLREQADTLLYGIGKYILEAYDCFEE